MAYGPKWPIWNYCAVIFTYGWTRLPEFERRNDCEEPGLHSFSNATLTLGKRTRIKTSAKKFIISRLSNVFRERAQLFRVKAKLTFIIWCCTKIPAIALHSQFNKTKIEIICLQYFIKLLLLCTVGKYKQCLQSWQSQHCFAWNQSERKIKSFYCAGIWPC